MATNASGFAVYIGDGSNLVIESPHQNNGSKRVVVERADVVDLIQFLQGHFCMSCGREQPKTGPWCQCDNDD